MFEFSTKKLSISEVWLASFALYKQVFRKIWYLVLLMVAIILGSHIIGNLMHVTTTAAAKQLSHISMIGVLIEALGAIIGLFIMAIIVHRIYNLVTDSAFHLKTSVRYIASKFLIIFSCLVVVYIAVVAGIVLFVIPGLFLGILFMFSLLCIIFDNAGWLGAIKMSSKLVWGDWWRAFLIFIVPSTVITMVQLGLSFVFKSNIWVLMVITALAMTVLKPYLDSVLLVLFNDLKLRKKAVVIQA
ncbi:MAG: hypothetical protein KAT71_02590 [Gammaproteobacteria bacterium]|nr:hypothetical protein [Gammaproteobacteria bacterium]